MDPYCPLIGRRECPHLKQLLEAWKQSRLAVSDEIA